MEAVREQLAANIPGRAGDEEFVRQMASYMRLCASPTTFSKMSEMAFAIDVREALSTIRAPTLVIHIDPPEGRLNPTTSFPARSTRAATSPSGSRTPGSSS